MGDEGVLAGDEWLVDESATLTATEALEATLQELRFDRATEAAVNVALFDVTIHDTKKWFGPAEVRVDALVVTPAPTEDQLYHANTFTFPGVRDGQVLPIDRDTGLGLYTGWPQYLLDIALIASRGGQDQKTLAEIMADGADQFGDLLGNVAKLTIAAPQAAAITGAGAAAAKLSGTILRLLAKETGKSIGLYRATWYENRHRFGLGNHPPGGGLFREQDFEFRYEVFQDHPATG
jgi:hypothetical protein